METDNKLRVILVAEEAAGVHALRRLSKSGHLIMGVLTTLNSSNLISEFTLLDVFEGDKKKSTIEVLAKSMGVPVFDSKSVQDSDFAKWMVDIQIDILLNVHSLYKICNEVVKAPKMGAFNLHPGPLPSYSGLNVPSWAVYNEESTHAATIHQMSEEIDTGNVIYEVHFPISNKDTGLSVSLACVQKGLDLIDLLLMELGNNPLNIPIKSQNLNNRHFYKRNQIPNNGFIDWENPAHKIDAFVRACNYSPFTSPWGEPKAKLKNTEIAILKTEVSSIECDKKPGTVSENVKGEISVATNDFWILITKCKLNGKSILPSDLFESGDFLSSSQESLLL